MNVRRAPTAILLLAAALPMLPARPARAADDRSTEILRYECRTDTTRREVTLFANGTLRVRDGVLGNEGMGLVELGPDDLKAFLNRLSAEDLTRDRSPDRGMEGAWVEHCELRLQLPGKKLQVYTFGQYDPLPLNLSKIVHIAREMGDKVRILKEADEIPADYAPQPGDVVKRAGDGALFRIVGFTSDKKGIELRGVVLPLEVYVPRDQLRQSFTALVSRNP
jgi:hypothetical protein